MNKHPEGLPFEPTGPGFTSGDNVRNGGVVRRLLLSDHNIASIKRKHADAFEAARFALETMKLPMSGIDPKTGAMKQAGWTEQDIERLAAMSVFVQLGLVREEPVT